jgi:hypothetical protein
MSAVEMPRIRPVAAGSERIPAGAELLFLLPSRREEERHGTEERRGAGPGCIDSIPITIDWVRGKTGRSDGLVCKMKMKKKFAN